MLSIRKNDLASLTLIPSGDPQALKHFPIRMNRSSVAGGHDILVDQLREVRIGVKRHRPPPM